MKTMIALASPVLVVFLTQQSNAANFQLENTKSVYETSKGTYTYEFGKQDNAGRIVVKVTSTDSSHQTESSEKHVNVMDYVLAHQTAERIVNECASPKTYKISGKEVHGCRIDGPNGYIVYSPDVPLSKIESHMNDTNDTEKLVELKDN